MNMYVIEVEIPDSAPTQTQWKRLDEVFEDYDDAVAAAIHYVVVGTSIQVGVCEIKVLPIGYRVINIGSEAERERKIAKRRDEGKSKCEVDLLETLGML